MHVALTTMCDDGATTTKGWAPFSPPDEFDVVDATLSVSWVLATIWARGRAPGGRVEGVVGTLLIVELGSPVFLGKHDGCAVRRDNSTKKYGTPPNKVCLQTKSGSGNTMVMSELTGGVDGLGILVFLMCSTYGRYIGPDQQGDSVLCSSFDFGLARARQMKSKYWTDQILKETNFGFLFNR